jgi:hypothetical protein
MADDSFFQQRAVLRKMGIPRRQVPEGMPNEEKIRKIAEIGKDWPIIYLGITPLTEDSFYKMMEQVKNSWFRPDTMLMHPLYYAQYDWQLLVHDIFRRVDFDRLLFPRLTNVLRWVQARRIRRRLHGEGILDEVSGWK